VSIRNFCLFLSIGYLQQNYEDPDAGLCMGRCNVAFVLVLLNFGFNMLELLVNGIAINNDQ
jgi:hypothetical protein